MTDATQASLELIKSGIIEYGGKAALDEVALAFVGSPAERIEAGISSFLDSVTAGFREKSFSEEFIAEIIAASGVMLRDKIAELQAAGSSVA